MPTPEIKDNIESSEKVQEIRKGQKETQNILRTLQDNISNQEISDPKISDMFFYENYEEAEIQGPGEDLPHIVFREDTDGHRELQKLEEWVKNKYSSDYIKKENQLKERYANKTNKEQYVKYELLMFCLQKYSEEVNQKHQTIIKEIYKDEDEYKKAMDKASNVFDKIQKTIETTYPGIQKDIQEVSEVYDKIEKQRQGWLIKDEKATEERYQEYQKEKLKNEFHITKLQKDLNMNPQTQDEARKLGETLEQILKLSGENEDLKKKYNISNYEHYLNNTMFLIKQYGKDKFLEQTKKIKEYSKTLNEIKQGSEFDFDKYQQYIDKRKAINLDNHFNTISQFQDILTIKEGNERFPLTLGELQTEELNKIRAERENEQRRKSLKKEHPFLYHTANNVGALRNGIIRYTAGTGFELGAMVCNLRHTPEEMYEVYERKDHWISNLSMQRSKAQTAPLYSHETGWNRTIDNTPGAVIDSVIAMYTLIYTGGFFEGGLKAAGAGAKLAAGGGLFTSGLISQLGNSYEEGFNVGLRGKDLIEYATISSSIQAGLELVSPNRFLLGEGDKVMKKLIANILKEGNKKNFIQVGKLFLKNMGMEVAEENLQEALQLAAGNLINMIANDQYQLGENGLNVDWSWENFASTALLTTLTTGITAGAGFKPSQESRAKLINQIKENKELHNAFNKILNKAIDGEVEIPGATSDTLEKLKEEIGNINNLQPTEEKEGKKSDYFEGKKSKFGITIEQAKGNSEFMDNIIKNLTFNQTEQLDQIRNRIIEQYETATGKTIENPEEFLPNGAIHTIIDTHTQPGIMGEHTFIELLHKTQFLEGIDQDVIRFLLEAGFCGSYKREIPTAEQTFRKYESKGVTLYIENKQIDHVEDRHANSKLQDIRCFEDKAEIQHVANLFGQGLTNFLEDLKNSPNEWNTLNRKEEDPQNSVKHILINTNDPKYKSLIVQVQIGEDNNFRVVSFYTPNNKDLNDVNPYLVCNIDTTNNQGKEEERKYKEPPFGIDEFYTQLTNTETMRDLNKTLTEKAKIFMNIAYLSDTTYKDKVKNGEIKFVFKDGIQQIQYGNLIINENTFFSEAGKKEWKKMLELNDEQKYKKLQHICIKEGSRCFLNLIDFDYSQMSKDEMLTILLQVEPDTLANETKQDKYNNIFNNTIEYCSMEERMNPDFLITYCKDFLNPELETTTDIVKVFHECKDARRKYTKEVKNLREEKNSILEEFKNTKDITNIDTFSQKLDKFIGERNLKTPLESKKIENARAQNDNITTKLNKIEYKLDRIANNRPQMQKIFNINEHNIKEFEAFLDNLKNQNFSDSDKIKMNFFLRTLFIASQIESDPVYQERGLKSQELKQNYLQEFGEGNELLLFGNTKSLESTITKLSKDPGYPYIDMLNDVVRFTYQLESTGNEVTDVQNLINLIGKFSEETTEKVKQDPKNQDKNIKPLIFNSKFKGIFDKDAEEEYIYIKACTVIKDDDGKELYSKITTLNGDTFYLKQIPGKGNTGKSASGKGYKDIKITYVINGTPFELKFMTSKRAENNEKGTSNHDIMRMIENINKTTRKYGLISENVIQTRINRIWNILKQNDAKDHKIFQELYDDEALDCKKDGDFASFDPNNAQNMEKLKENFTQFIFSKYREVGQLHDHKFYVNEENIYLNEAYKDYVKNLGGKGKELSQTYIAFLQTLLQNPEYFSGKISKFKISKEDAIKNSQFMDGITENNKNEKLKELGKKIQTQYESATGIKISLTTEQLQIILDTHKMEGELGNLTLPQLKGKIEKLATIIEDTQLRRFLIEAGFCGELNCAELAENILHTMKNETSVNIDDILKDYYITTKTRKFCEIKDGYNEEADEEWDNRDSIYETLFAGTKRKYGMITIFNQDKQSIHLAFIDCDGNYYDQQGANGLITEAGNVEDLLADYKQTGGIYYKLYSLNGDLEERVKAGLEQ